MSVSIKPTEDERKLAVQWVFISILTGALTTIFGMLAAMPLDYFISAPSPAEGIRRIQAWAAVLASDPKRVLSGYALWWRQNITVTGIPPISWILAMVLGTSVFTLRLARNPYNFARTEHGSARNATYKDLKKADLFCDSGIVLGRWKNTFRAIRNWETLSTIVIAPPGTGKSVQLVANLLADWPDTEPVTFMGIPTGMRRRKRVPGPSMIINDPKGEIYDITAGWRSMLGPTFKLSWGDARGSARWNPLSARSYPGGRECAEQRAAMLAALETWYEHPGDVINGVLKLLRDGSIDWAQTWAADPTCVGAKLKIGIDLQAAGRAVLELATKVEDLQNEMSKREQHIDRLCAILIPDTIEAHWKNTGREFLSGAIGYIIAHAERLSEEPTFGMLLDELNKTTSGQGFRDPQQVRLGAEGGEHQLHGETIPGLGTQTEPSGGDAQDQDLTAQILDEWIEACIAYGYPARIQNDLVATRMKPDRERGSVISTAGASINIFKNASVRAVTSSSSFDLEDLRGIDGLPTTFYIPIPLSDAEVFGRVTGLFIETAAAWGISQNEKDIKKTRPILVLADEFWTMPPLQSLLQIPALGRGQWFQVIIVGQSYGQISMKYRNSGGGDVVDALKAATAYKVIPTQADLKTAQEISNMIGNKTVRQESVSRSAGLMGTASINRSESYTGKPLVAPDRIMSMEKLDPAKKQWGWQIVLLLGMINRPILCRPYAWFEDKKMKPRAGLSIIPWSRDENGRIGPQKG